MTAEQESAAALLLDDGHSYRKICEQTGLSLGALQRYIKRRGWVKPIQPPDTKRVSPRVSAVVSPSVSPPPAPVLKGPPARTTPKDRPAFRKIEGFDFPNHPAESYEIRDDGEKINFKSVWPMRQMGTYYCDGEQKPNWQFAPIIDAIACGVSDEGIAKASGIHVATVGQMRKAILKTPAPVEEEETEAEPDGSDVVNLTGPGSAHFIIKQCKKEGGTVDDAGKAAAAGGHALWREDLEALYNMPAEESK